MRILLYFIIIAIIGLFASLARAQTNGDLILQFKDTNGAKLQFVTPSTGTGLLGFNGASPNRMELLPRSTFATPADVAAYAQPLDSDLTTLAGVTSTATGRNLLSSSSATAAKTALGFGPTGGLGCFTFQVIQSPTELVPGYFAFIDSTQTHIVKVGANAAPTSSFTIDLPTAAGEWLTSGSALNADNISTGSLTLARLAQTSATTGQAIVWNGSAWAPGTVSAPVASVAGRTGAITLSTSDVSGLGTMATQAADNVAVTGGSVALTGAFSSSLNGAVSAPAVSITGTWYSGGTATTTKPQVLIQPSNATSTAWSTGGTGLGVNSASGFTGKLWDFQANGTSIFSGIADGYIYVRGLPALIYADANTLGIGLNAIATRQAGSERLWVVGGIGFAPLSTAPNANDTYLMRRATGSLGMGLASGTPSAQYMGGQDATGTNVAGGAWHLRGGNGTGSGGGGSLKLETAAAGSSGSTANTFTTHIEITKAGHVIMATLPTSSAGLAAGTLWNDAGTLKVAP